MKTDVTIKLSRKDLKENFKVEPQEIKTEAHLSFEIIRRVESIINRDFVDLEAFCLAANLEVEPVCIIGTSRIDNKSKIILASVVNYYDEVLSKEPVDLGTC